MLTLLAAAAFARAPTPDLIEEGAVVVITGVGPADAFHRQRRYIVGLACGVEEGGMTRERGRWYSGSVTCGAEGNFYFYNVSVELDTHGYDYAALTGHAVGEPMPGTAPSPWPDGARVTIEDVSAGDAHVGAKSTLVGATCTVSGADLVSSGDVWFSGPLSCDNAGDWYFYQVKVGPAAAAASAPGGAASPGVAGAAFAAGKMVKVTEVGAADAHHAARAALVGRTCTVVEVPLYALPDGWLAGRLFCDDGQRWQLLQVKVTAP